MELVSSPGWRWGWGVVCRECEDKQLPRAQPWDFSSLKARGKAERLAREAGRTCPQAVYATFVESIPKGLAGRHQEGIQRNKAPRFPFAVTPLTVWSVMGDGRKKSEQRTHYIYKHIRHLYLLNSHHKQYSILKSFYFIDEDMG